MKCINLKQRFGDRYKVAYEQSHYADHGAGTRTDDPWLQIIPCLHGHICPWGGDLLSACTDRRGPVAKHLAELPFTTLVQDGADGVNVTFNVAHFDEVAKIMKPRRRCRLSESQRQAAAERLKPHQFSARQNASDVQGCVSRRRRGQELIAREEAAITSLGKPT